MTKKYQLNKGGYVIKGSLNAGKWVLNELKKQKIKLKVHLCTADLKNQHQFRNRLKRHEILPYGKKTEEGTVLYLVADGKLKMTGTFYDRKKDRTILSEETARKLLGKRKIMRVEEFPTYDAIDVESEEIE